MYRFGQSFSCVLSVFAMAVVGLLILLFVAASSRSQETSEEKLAAEFEADLNQWENPLFEQIESDFATDVAITQKDEAVTDKFPSEKLATDFEESMQILRESISVIVAKATDETEKSATISAEEKINTEKPATVSAEEKVETIFPTAQDEPPLTSTVKSPAPSSSNPPTTTVATTDASTVSATVAASTIIEVSSQASTPPSPVTPVTSRKKLSLARTQSKILLVDTRTLQNSDEEDEEELDGNGRPAPFRNSALNGYLAKKKKARKESTTEYDPLAAFFSRYTVKPAVVTERMEVEEQEQVEVSTAKPVEQATGRNLPGLKKFGFTGNVKRPLLKQNRVGEAAGGPLRFSPAPQIEAPTTKRAFIKPSKFSKKFGKPARREESQSEEAGSANRRNLFRPRSPSKFARPQVVPEYDDV